MGEANPPVTAAPEQAVPRSALLGGLPPDELQLIESRMTPQTVTSGTVLLAQGALHGVLYLVRSGVLSVDATTDAGVVRHLARLTPGECAGEMSLLTGMPVSATVSAVTGATVGVLRQSDFIQLLGLCPSMARNVSIMLSQRLSNTIRGDVPGFARLMRVRLHNAVTPEIVATIARSTAFHLDSPLLVIDHVGLDAWSDEERLPAIGEIVGGRGSVLEAATEGGPRLLVTDARGANAERWFQLEAQLPRHHIFGFQITPPQTDESLPERLLGVDADVLLWPDAGERVRDRSQLTVLLANGQRSNSASSLDAASTRYDAQVIRIVSPAGGTADAQYGWVARELAGLKVGLALGGGGARGGAHLGVLQGLKRASVPIDYITGCSVGAGLAAGVAYGLDIDELITMIMQFARHVIKYTIPRHSLLSSSGLRNFYRHMVGETLIEDLELPLAVVAADLLHARELILDRGLLWKAVLASTSLPGIYPPVWIGEYCLVDGGVLNPVPATLTRALGADTVLAVKLDAPGVHQQIRCRAEETRSGNSPSVLTAISRSFEVMASEITAHVVEGADVVVAVETGPMTLRDFQEGTKLLPSGTKALQGEWPRIQSVLPWLRHTPAPAGE